MRLNGTSRVGRYLRATLWILLALIILPLACLRVAASVRESHPGAQAAPRTGRFVHAGDVEVFIQEDGPSDGPPVLLVHGTGAWSEIWRETMSVLARGGYRAIAIDLPPFGFSQRPSPPSYGDLDQARRIVGVLDALKLERVTQVGHSFGARPTVTAAYQVLPRVAALVLIDPALTILPPGAALPRPSAAVRLVLSTSLIRDPLVSATLSNPYLTRRLLRALIWDPDDATEARVRMFRRQATVEGTTPALGRWLRAFMLDDQPSPTRDSATYRALTMPTLLLWGQKDRITPLSQSQPLLALLPHAELNVLRDAGHIPAIEDPPAFNAALIAFLDRQRMPLADQVTTAMAR